MQLLLIISALRVPRPLQTRVSVLYISRYRYDQNPLTALCVHSNCHCRLTSSLQEGR